MKYVVNTCYGGFSISDQAKEILGLDTNYPDDDIREDPFFIEMVEKDPTLMNGSFSRLKVLTIPDDATDWMLMEYDGTEAILYVQNGKMEWAV